MGFFGDLINKALGKESSDDGSQSIKDEYLARLYEDCSAGHLPIITNPPIILKRGEAAHFVSRVSVIEQKTETMTYRAYAGTRLRIGSLPVYVGGSAPKKVSNEALVPIGEGYLLITNRRVVLSGTKINYSASLDKITHCTLMSDALQILWEGRYGGRFYKMDDPRPAALILVTLISGIPSPEAIGLDSSVSPTNPGDFVWFASEGQTETVAELLDKGFDPNTRDEYGLTPLIAAASNGHADLVSLLLDRGADPNIETDLGYTALMFAALDGHCEVVRVLLRNGANINLKNKDGMTALRAALCGEHREVAELLRAYGGK